MPMTNYPVNQTWQAGARYTAAAEVAINLSNASPVHSLRWTTTADDTAPTMPVINANPLKPEADKAMTLPAGARLWIASLSGEGSFAGVEVMP